MDSSALAALARLHGGPVDSGPPLFVQNSPNGIASLDSVGDPFFMRDGRNEFALRNSPLRSEFYAAPAASRLRRRPLFVQNHLLLPLAIPFMIC
jgi:hypothetical protein